MDLSELRTLVELDEQALAHYGAGRLAACAERCGAIATPLRRSIDASEIQKHASLSGAWAKIVLARESAQTPAEVRGVCLTFLDWIRKDWPIDFDLPEVQAMLGALVQAGLVTAEQAEELNSLGDYPQTFTTDEILAAMKG